MATKPHSAATKSGATGFEDYNPFAEDSMSKVALKNNEQFLS